MKTLIKIKSALLFTLLALITLPAKALEVGVEGGINYWNPTSTSTGETDTYSSSAATTFGVFAKGSLNFLFDAEVGIYSMNKKSTEAYAGTLTGTYNLQTSSYVIPVIVRTSFVPGGLFNVGAGAYYEIGTSSGITVNGVNQTYAASNVKNNDIGLVLSGQVRLPIAPLIHVLVDARYLYGLTEQSTITTASEKNRNLQFLAGVSVGF